MSGPAKYIAQLVLAGAQIVGRAFARALKEEIQRSQQAAASRGGGGTRAGDSSRAAAVSSRLGMTVQEACQILNLPGKRIDPKELTEKYDHLFKVNDKAVGGSFYLQSKVVRAKERLEEELKSLAEAPKERPGRTSQEKTPSDSPS
ncbi:mitochondrial import inner membrane translocase subunit tim16-B-like [Paramacrobiotus metropolitanus]|uniref:mitochondrial import inner membrane translocase subunit tim16-B-like n=1 Tax=Paramacrobiotus metropolitanus TaxID=2943436 RepID=UPI002445A5E3|nr:mitochondrial import inner membrane translocase subunit tim16-B-like [Paramacrobiotus metropolitanus]